MELLWGPLVFHLMGSEYQLGSSWVPRVFLCPCSKGVVLESWGSGDFGVGHPQGSPPTTGALTEPVFPRGPSSH